MTVFLILGSLCNFGNAEARYFKFGIHILKYYPTCEKLPLRDTVGSRGHLLKCGTLPNFGTYETRKFKFGIQVDHRSIAST